MKLDNLHKYFPKMSQVERKMTVDIKFDTWKKRTEPKQRIYKSNFCDRYEK